MSMNISNPRKVTMKIRGLEHNPIATFADYTSMAGSTVTSSVATSADGAAANAANGGTYDFWIPTAVPARFIVVRAVAFEANFIGIVAHNIGTLGGLTVTAQYSQDGVSWTDLGFSIVPTDDQNIGLYFENINARQFRVSIDGAAPASQLYVGVIQVAKAITFPTRIYQGYTPPLQATSVALQSNVTEGNNYVGSSVVRGGMGASASLSLLADDFVRGDDFQAFQSRFNAAKPFFWAWRPLKYDDLLYAWRSGSPIIPSNTGPKAYMGFDMAMRAYDDKS